MDAIRQVHKMTYGLYDRKVTSDANCPTYTDERTPCIPRMGGITSTVCLHPGAGGNT
jgi:hypothetical protein